ncbi:MAG: 4'-phosphopantetheinyl transferase superfamily protein [Acidimicrobiales bacterium]
MAGLSVVGLGVDAVDLDRVRLALERTPTLVDRIYTPAERAYCEARRDPTERFAVRFAAKEAALKALGIGVFRVPLTDIEVMAPTAERRPWCSWAPLRRWRTTRVWRRGTSR